MSEKIRVLLVDDHTLFRSGIKSLLQRNDDFEVVGEAGDGLEGIKRVRSLKPDVALLDLHMPGVSGLEAVKVISEEMPEVNVLMLTVSEDAQDLMDALRAGASGYLLKGAPPDELLLAVRSAAAGESALAPPIASRLLERLRTPQTSLSPREIEVLERVAAGRSNGEIARELVITEQTVKSHLVHIYTKLGVSSRTAAVSLARERGILRS